MHTSTRFAGVAAGITMAFGSIAVVTPAVATAPAKPAACTQQQKQVDRAESALARVTAVFERQQAKVKKAKHRATAADTAHQRNAARKALRKAKHDKTEAAKTKRAQQQRLAKAEDRLETCQAEQD